MAGSRVSLDPVTYRNLQKLKGVRDRGDKEMDKAEALGILPEGLREAWEQAKRDHDTLLTHYSPTGISLEEKE